MKRNRKYWKTSAKAALRGNWIIAIAGMLAYMAVNFLGNVLSLELFPGNSMLEIAAGQIFVFVVSLIAMVFGTGYSYMMLNMSRGREFSLGNLLYMFHNQPDRVLIAAFVMALLNTVSQLPIYFAVYLTDPGADELDADDHGNHDPECSTECTYHSTACAQFLSSGR